MDEFDQNRRGGYFWTSATQLFMRIQKSAEKYRFRRKVLFGVDAICCFIEKFQNR
jgi:hypothetical protein